MDEKKRKATIVGQSRILRKGDWGLGWDWHGDQCPNRIDIQQKNCEGIREGGRDSTNWGRKGKQIVWTGISLFRERFIKTY